MTNRNRPGGADDQSGRPPDSKIGPKYLLRRYLPPPVYALLKAGSAEIRAAVAAARQDLDALAEKGRSQAEMSPAEVSLIAEELGFRGARDLVDALGLPAGTRDHWEQGDVAPEAAALLRLLAHRQRATRRAAEEFDAATHAGLIEFLEDAEVLARR